MLAAVFGLLGFACSAMAFRRLRSQCNPVRAARWITIGALISGMAAAFAGPITLRADAMPHWIGFHAQDALIRSFLGVLIGIAVVYGAVRFLGVLQASKQRCGTFWCGIAEGLLLLVFVGAVNALWTLSAYVGFFVLLQLAIMVGVFAMYVRSALAPAADSE